MYNKRVENIKWLVLAGTFILGILVLLGVFLRHTYFKIDEEAIKPNNENPKTIEVKDSELKIIINDNTPPLIVNENTSQLAEKNDIETENLGFIDSEVLEQIDNESSKELFEKENSDPRNFVKLDWRNGMPYDLTCRLIKKENLSLLYKMLNDQNYAPYWHNVARVIGYISDDPESVPVIIDYFQRDDGTNISSLAGKIWSIAFIGKIGGDNVDGYLQKAATREGAIELTKEWIDKELWPDKNWSKSKAIDYIQNAAMRGLVFTGKPENIEIVEKMYKNEYDTYLTTQNTTDMFGFAVDSMVAKDFIAEHDIDSYLNVNPNEIFGKFGPYIVKYSPPIPSDIMNKLEGLDPNLIKFLKN